MHVISRRSLREFAERHPGSEAALDFWYRVALRARWASIAEVRRDFPHADAYRTCTVFNVAGNNYRLVAKIYYQDQVLLVRAVLAHAEYDREGWKDDC